MSEVQLKPCPFCGTVPTIRLSDSLARVTLETAFSLLILK